MVKESCPFCRNTDAAVHYNALAVYRCLACGLLFRGTAALPSDVAGLYKDAWSDALRHTDATGETDLELARQYLRRMLRAAGAESISGLRVLDFGAGRGWMLSALVESGADACGVEPYGYGHLKERGLNVYRGINDLPQGMLFDAVITADVIEHIQAPWDTLKRLYGLVKPGGWLYLATPNASSLNALLSGARWREFNNPGHLYFFNARCVENFLSGMGLRQYQRLYWFIRYDTNIARLAAHFILKLVKADGELRYIIRKPDATLISKGV